MPAIVLDQNWTDLPVGKWQPQFNDNGVWVDANGQTPISFLPLVRSNPAGDEKALSGAFTVPGGSQYQAHSIPQSANQVRLNPV